MDQISVYLCKAVIFNFYERLVKRSIWYGLMMVWRLLWRRLTIVEDLTSIPVTVTMWWNKRLSLRVTEGDLKATHNRSCTSYNAGGVISDVSLIAWHWAITQNNEPRIFDHDCDPQPARPIVRYVTTLQHWSSSYSVLWGRNIRSQLHGLRKHIFQGLSVDYVIYRAAYMMVNLIYVNREKIMHIKEIVLSLKR